MPKTYNPADWYWRRADGKLYASARQQLVTDGDEAFTEWGQDGTKPTLWPKDEAGQESDDELQNVLNSYGLSLPDRVPVPASVTSAQAKIQCLRTPGAEAGATLLDDITAEVEKAGGEVKIWFAEARTWERTNPYIDSLSKGLQLSSAQVDALFAAAAKIAA